MIPGKVENWTAIFDFENVGALSSKNLQLVARAMQKNYPGRLYRFFGIKVSLIFRAFWVVAHQFVDDFTKRKMSIHGGDYQKELLNLIPAENLQKKYGGQSDDITTFWPPQMA